MTTYAVALDPTAILPTRAELALNASNGINVEHAGIDWGESQIKAFLAEQLYGEVPTEYRVPNRQVSIPLGLGMSSGATEEVARERLQQKVALLQRQGGVLLRQREGAEPLYADVMNASLTIPDVYGETGAVEPGAVLKLECLPDFYGPEIELETIEGTGQAIGPLQKAKANAVIAGDYPARTRLVLTEGEGILQKSLIWGVRSTRYPSAAELSNKTAELFLDASLLTLMNGAVAVGRAGTYSGNAVELKEPAVNTWHPFIETKIASSGKHQTHVGTYRVWARLAAAAGQRFRLSWSNALATSAIINSATSVPLGGGWWLADLGEIRIEESPIGEHFWRGVLAVETGEKSYAIEVDRLWLQPLDDGAGKLRATAPATTGALLAKAVPATVSQLTEAERGVWTTPENVTSKVGASANVALSLSTAMSQRIQATNCSLSSQIPEGVSIKGFEVRLVTSTSPAGKPLEVFAQLYQGSVKGTEKRVLAGATTVIGGPSDMWGTSLKAKEVRESNFGLQMRAYDIGGASITVYAAYLEIFVYWAYEGVTVLEDAVLNASRKAQVRFDGSYREDLSDEGYVRVTEETGDLLRIPPSGLENRPVQLFVKQSEGIMPGIGGTQGNDGGRDLIRAQVFYRPCYIGRI